MNIEKLTDDERQETLDALHQAGVYPSRLNGAGSPAHVEAVNANLNDLRNMLRVEIDTVNKFFEVLGLRKQPAPTLTPAPGQPKLPDEKSHEDGQADS